MEHEQRRDVLLSILERWYEGAELGEPPALEELCASNPDLLDTVRDLIAGEQRCVEGGQAPVVLEEADGVPTVIPGYRLLSILGEGGMGRVYLAYQESLRRLVAVKLLRTRAVEPSRIIRFRREAEIVASLDHPNIVPVLEFGEVDGCLWLAMKRLRGVPLSELPNPLPWKEAAVIGAAIARALHVAHSVGIIHRDVKPSNIILDGETPWLLDFGLARGVNDPTLTSEGQNPGTLPYMAPEQLKGTPVLDPRTDIYGLGCTLYELVGGRSPFGSERPEATIHSILFENPPRLDLRGAGRQFEVVLACALEKDVSRRYASALQLAEDLDSLVAGSPIKARPPGVARRIADRFRRNKAAWLSGAILLTLSMAFALIALDQRSTNLRKRSEEIRRISAALEAEEWYSAWDRADETSFTGADIDELKALTRAAIDREELLDFLWADFRHQDVNHLDELLRSLDAAPPNFVAQPLTSLSHSLAALYMGRRDNARELSESPTVKNRFPRAASIVSRLASGLPLESLLNRVPASDAVDCSLSALALLISECPAKIVQEEIERALRRDSTNARALKLLAHESTLLNNFDRAEEIWRGLINRPDVGFEVHLGRWQTAYHRGNRDLAEKCLEAALETNRARRRPASLMICAAQIIHAIRYSPEIVGRLVSDGYVAFGRIDRLLFLDGYRLGLVGDVASARALLEESLKVSRTPRSRRQVEAMIINYDLADWLQVPAEEKRERHSEILDRAITLADTAETSGDHRVASMAYYAQYVILEYSTDVFAAHDCLKKAITLDDQSIEATHAWVKWIFYEILVRGKLKIAPVANSTAFGAQGAEAFGATIAEARECASKILTRLQAEGAADRGALLEEMLLWDAVLAWQLDDRDSAARQGASAYRLARARRGGELDFVGGVLEALRKELGLTHWTSDDP